MIVVDSSVWIDHFRNTASTQADKLRTYLTHAYDAIYVPDVVLLELLRGCQAPKEFARLDAVLSEFHTIEVGGVAQCRRAAKKYAALRAKGFTTSKTVDLLIASWCIDEGVALLHDDQDFTPFVGLGLKTV